MIYAIRGSSVAVGSYRAVIGCLGLFFLLPLVLLLTAQWWLPGIGYWLAVSPQARPADAIVVLGGGGPQRQTHGISLYKKGLAPELWYTGDGAFAARTTFTEAQFAYQFALAEGIPAEAVHLLKTTSTWEDGRQIATTVHQKGLRRLLIVTNWSHSRRALCVIRQHLAGSGVSVYYDPPPVWSSRPDNWWQHEGGLVEVINELIKFGFYWWRHGLAPWSC